MMHRQHINQFPAHITTYRGFVIVSAIFLLIVLGALGAFMMNLSVLQRGSTSLSLISSRVFYGAKSGLEWGIHQAVAPAAGNGVCNPSTGFSFTSSDPGLNGVSVTVTCAVATNTLSSTTYRVYTLTSTATFGTVGNSDYAERKLRAVVCRSDSATAAAC